MSNIDCNDSKYTNTPMCICKKGIDSYITANEEYKQEKDKYEEELKSWNEWNNINTQRLQITGDYRSYYNNRKQQLLNDTRNTRNYTSIDDARSGNHDDWCINDYGVDWTNIPEDTRNINTTLKYSHPGFYFAKCQRTDSAIDRIIKEEMLANYPAYTKTSDKRQDWNDTNKPVFSYSQPNPLNITCCTQIIDDIQAGNKVDINNISQKCGNSTENQQHVPSTETNSILKIKYYIKNYYIYIIVCILLIFSISSVLSMFLGGDDSSIPTDLGYLYY